MAARARDCIVALSDRKETIGGGGRDGEVTKYHLDAAGGYYIALAGDGTVAGIILNELRQGHVARFNIFREIEKLAAEMHVAQDTKNAAGHLIVSDNGRFKTYLVRITSGIATFFSSDKDMIVEGDIGAIAICKDLTQDMALTNMSCDTAVKCLHTLAARVAKTVDSVGERSEYGIDMVVFAEAGTVKQIPRSMDKMGAIRARFEECGEGRPQGSNRGA